MKSRSLHTVHDVVVSNYAVTQLPSGKYRHRFTPATTDTLYEFEASDAPALTEGARYNVGYYVDEQGRNIVDTSTLLLVSEVNPKLSLAAARNNSQAIYADERKKNDERVTHRGSAGYYWGKKQAWRVFGLVIPKSAFYAYLDEIGHPTVECVVYDPGSGHGHTKSIAYLENGLERAVEDLISTAVPAAKGYYKSPRYSKQFSIYGPEAMTDKK